MLLNWSNSNNHRRILIEFIRLYKRLPALWNIKLKVYNDRHVKRESYKILLVKYKEMYPNATMEDLKKRINSFRTNFRREFKKVRDSQTRMMTNGIEKVYHSHLWYYKEFLFLCDEESFTPDKKIDGNQEIELDPLDITVIDTKFISDTTQFAPHNHDDYQTSKKEDFDKITLTWANDLQKMEGIQKNTPKGKNMVHKDDDFDPLCNRTGKQEDDFECIAKTWANDLRKMDRIQQILARKAINDILFEGQLGTLHRNSLQINVNVSKDPSDSLK